MGGYWSLKQGYWDINLLNRDIRILSLLKVGYWDIGISNYQDEWIMVFCNRDIGISDPLYRGLTCAKATVPGCFGAGFI